MTDLPDSVRPYPAQPGASQPDGGSGSSEIYGDLELPEAPTSGRPYVVLNMVASVDGRTSISGRAGGIGGEADRKTMRTLRSRVDAVMVGAGTLRAEKVDLRSWDTSRVQPLAVILGGKGDLPLAENLLRGGQGAVGGPPQRVLVIIPRGMPEGVLDRGFRVLTAGGVKGKVDLREALGVLRREYGVARLLVEGGPSLNAALLEAGLLDEVFLTIAPKLISGDGSRILSRPSQPDGPSQQALELISVYAAGHEVFLRYRIPRR